MTIALRFQPDSRRLQEALNVLRKRRTPRYRQRLAQRVLEQVVERVIARHPVETGRARDAWMQGIDQIRTGSNENTNDARSDRTEEADRTSVEVTNEVDYVVYLENGTRKMEPRRMVGRAVAESPAIVAQTSAELFGELVTS